MRGESRPIPLFSNFILIRKIREVSYFSRGDFSWEHDSNEVPSLKMVIKLPKTYEKLNCIPIRRTISVQRLAVILWYKQKDIK